MSVPFDRLGPGQVGRAVYQVMGSDGPISNPSRIRFLPLSEAPDLAESVGALPSAAALSGLNLIASVGAAALSAETLRQIHALHEKVDQLALNVRTIDAKMDALLAKVARIDARVAENNLRNAMDHLVRRAVGPSEVDVRELARLEGDLETMFESIDDWCVGSAPGLRLSTDTADRLRAVYSTLASTRAIVMAQYNVLVGGDPGRVLSFDPRVDYLFEMAEPGAVATYEQITRVLREGRDAIKADVDSHFSFATSDDMQRYHEVFDVHVFDPVLAVMTDADGLALSMAVDLADRLGAIEEHAERVSLADAYRRAWLWGTDAGLLWRTYVECLFLRGGYIEEKEAACLQAAMPPKLTVQCRVDADAVAALGAGTHTAVDDRIPREKTAPAERFAKLKR